MFSVCVCVLGSKCLTFFCSEMFLRDQNVIWILGWVACLIAFMSVFFSSWKTVFEQSRQLLNTSRHLAYLSSSSASFNRNLDNFSIALQSIELVFAMDSCSIVVSLYAFKARHLSICRELWDSYIYALLNFDLISLICLDNFSLFSLQNSSNSNPSHSSLDLRPKSSVLHLVWFFPTH